MKFGVCVFPATNCDHDTIWALSNGLGQDVVPLWHKDTDLQGCDVIILPGGFSYGDYLRCGAVAKFSPIMNEIIKYANSGGYVFGICNGFQILCESGLLPGVLLKNQNQKFICKNQWIVPTQYKSLLTSGLEKGVALSIPIAHGEGRYFAPPEQIETLESNRQVVFRYSDDQGNVTQESNPNDSLNNIAGIRNKRGNVFGMMPHPERASDSKLGNVDGLLIFNSIIENL